MNNRLHTHPCPIPGCRVTRLRFAMLMCRKHWAIVPRDMQDAVYMSWNNARPSPEYLMWRKAAIEYVQSAEARG